MQFEFLRTIVGLLDDAGIPHMLAGRRFDGRFVFDGDELIDQDLRLLDA